MIQDAIGISISSQWKLITIFRIPTIYCCTSKVSVFLSTKCNSLIPNIFDLILMMNELHCIIHFIIPVFSFFSKTFLILWLLTIVDVPVLVSLKISVCPSLSDVYTSILLIMVSFFLVSSSVYWASIFIIHRNRFISFLWCCFVVTMWTYIAFLCAGLSL